MSTSSISTPFSSCGLMPVISLSFSSWQFSTSVEATGSEDDFTYKPKHWEYEERELTQDEYSQYLIAMEQAKEINEHSDEEAIDNYTRQLMDEGVL